MGSVPNGTDGRRRALWQKKWRPFRVAKIHIFKERLIFDLYLVPAAPPFHVPAAAAGWLHPATPKTTVRLAARDLCGHHSQFLAVP